MIDWLKEANHLSEAILNTSLLDEFKLGAPMSSHDGIVCYPALKENSEQKYIVKTISIPASQVQLDALLLTGAYKDPADATDYFHQLADSVVSEAQFLQRLGKLDGFLPFESWDVVPMEKGKLGYEVHLVSTYKRSLEKYMRRNPVTHLEAVNLGLDLCQALAICRRAGHLYVDLKPSNVFMSKGKEYRIGDLGFVDLDSLRFTSLPAKYRSPYAPPEVQDDLKTLNDTVDTYALGMILYQVYNNGNLPQPLKDPALSYPTPSNADYEVAEIIMKALAPDPTDRWKDPMEMGQALIAYMQRNTVNNTPIVPPAAELPEDAEPLLPKEAREEPEPVEITQEAPEATTDSAEITSEEALSQEETAGEPEAIPEVAATEAPAETAAEEKNEEDDEFAFLFESGLTPEEAEEEILSEKAEEETPYEAPRKRSKSWILVVILVLLLGVLGACGFYYYQNIYLQSIDALTVDGSQDQITVMVDSDIQPGLLTVVCTDSYGNTSRQTVENGKVVFTGLLPNSQYKINLEIDGFHELVGKTSDVFHTDAQTSIVSFTGITGPEDGSVVLNFTMDGAEPEEWTVTYSADGEEPQVQSFTGHNVTVHGLTAGKDYTFTLDSSDDLALLGQTELKFTASRLILAQELTIVSCEDGNLTVRWTTPEDAVVDNWFVRCYSDGGYEQQMDIASATEAVFPNIDTAQAYTVEVFAEGMTQPARVSITENPITILGIAAEEENPQQFTVSWDYEGNAPEGGWLLMYSIDGSDTQFVVKCQEPSGVISPRIHGARYKFTIQAVDGTSVFNGIQTYTCPNAQIFEANALSAEKITAHLLKTPEKENWSYMDISTKDYTSSFAVGDKISLILHADMNFYIPEEETDLLFVFRDGSNSVVSELITEQTMDWKSMWLNQDYHYCELDLAKVPTEPGDYSLSLYFNGYAIMVITFTITE